MVPWSCKIQIKMKRAIRETCFDSEWLMSERKKEMSSHLHCTFILSLFCGHVWLIEKVAHSLFFAFVFLYYICFLGIQIQNVNKLHRIIYEKCQYAYVMYASADFRVRQYFTQYSPFVHQLIQKKVSFQMETILMNKPISVASIDYLLSVATNQPDGVSRQRLLNIDTRSV